ncbi:hypothetical protein IKE98_01870 [Candidatus Saccharibacteria bacterium]|nr:hypothetical protein [Candidatus Saccharibacteria bacterium]
MADGLKKNDPYREMEDSRKSDITPGFAGGNGSDGYFSHLGNTFLDGSPGPDGKYDRARHEFNNAESGAAGQDGEDGGFYRGDNGVVDAKKREESGGGLYNATTQGKGKGKGKKKFSFKGMFTSAKGAFITAAISILGVGGLMGATQFSQMFNIFANMSGQDNTMRSSAALRSGNLFKAQMDPEGRKVPDGVNVKDPVKGRFLRSDTFSISKKQANKLASQGIEYDKDFRYGDGSKKARVLKFTDSNGDVKIIAADPDVANKIGDGAVDFKTYYADNPDFATKYDAGSMTWRGAIANWFGNLTNKYIKDNNLTRNMTEDYREKYDEADADMKGKVAQEILAERTDEVEGGKYSRVDAEDDGQDGDGNPKYKADTEEEDIEGFSRKNMVDMSEAKSKFSKVADKVTGNASKVVNIGCNVMNVVGAISLLVSASEALQIINLTTLYYETVDKTKAGEGSDAPYKELSGVLNEQVENENDIIKSSGVAWNDYDESQNFTYDSSGEANGIKTLTTETITTKKSAIQSSGIASLFGGGPVDPNDPSVQSFNMTSSLKRLMGGLGTSMTMFSTCALAKLAVSLAGVVTDALEVAACIAGAIGAPFTFGASVAGCGPLIANTIKGIAVSVAVGVVVAAVVGAITPIAGKALTRDLVGDIGGEALGNALRSGSKMYLGGAHRANGGSLSNRAKYIAFAAEQDKVLAEDARYERMTLSPFDTTSSNTFMGVLVTKLMGFASSSTLMNAITTSSSAVTSSIVAMTPSASAYSINETLPTEEEYQDTCPYLASIGAVGDAYCNPYVVSDTSTMGLDPLTVVDAIGDNFNGETSDGNVVIDPNSDLANYITFCDQRQSAFGIADQNIVNAVTAGSTGSSVADSAIGAIPVIGDAIDVFGNATAVANVGYVGGESCVAGNTMDQYLDENGSIQFSASPGWDTSQYYQRFIEDQALMESMGVIEESAVSVFLDKYYEENPLDNSYEGILARRSGLDKETVVAILDLIDYGNYIAEYDPTERYAFGVPAVEKDNTILFDNENSVAADAVLLNAISFADVRNRSFAA